MEGTAISRARRLGSKSRTNYHITQVNTDCHSPMGLSWSEAMHISLRSFALATILLLLLIVGSLFHPAPLLATITEESLGGKTFAYCSDNPDVSLTYHSLWNQTETPVHSGDRISGDRVVLRGTWSPSDTVVQSRIDVNATAIPRSISSQNLSSSVWIDTRGLGNNATCIITVFALLLNGSTINQTFGSVFIGNFFVPHVRVLSPNGGEHWTGVNNVTWFGWDNNTGEQLTYEVLFSSDSGTSFQLLATHLSSTWYQWDCTGFLNLSTYMVEVRVTDGIYVSFDRSDGTFAAGDISITTTSTTTTTTTTTTNTTTTTIDSSVIISFFISAAMISSAVMALIVYYLAKRWY